VPTAHRTLGAIVQHQQLVVGSKEELDEAVARFTAAGYGPRQMSGELAILVRPGRQKSLGCAFVLLILVCFPLGILVAINRSRQAAEESTVTIRVEAVVRSDTASDSASTVPVAPQALRLSEDGERWWDGGSWIPVGEATPPMAKRNPDGSLWWDGTRWRAVR
jgi:hypothetical protein